MKFPIRLNRGIPRTVQLLLFLHTNLIIVVVCYFTHGLTAAAFSSCWDRSVPQRVLSRPQYRSALYAAGAPQKTNQPQPRRSPPKKQQFQHALAILAMPHTSMDRIVNEAVLETVLPTTRKLSVVLRCQGDTLPTTPSLRRYVGEIYSQLWDCSLAGDSMELSNPDLPDVVVYPQNLPNAAPESWIDIQPDLDCVCSHDAITGWSSTYASSSSSFRQAQRYATKAGNGQGGLDEHVDALNAERRQRGLKPVFALHTQNPITSILTERDPDVVFLDDEEQEEDGDIKFNQNDENCDVDSMNTDDSDEGCILAGSRLTSRDKLYESVCVGGTFDGMHFGHRKLLTLAVSSVEPVTGRLLVGITVDEMLRHKKLAEFIPPYAQRCQSVRDFLYRLAPGMTNRIRIQPISDSFGPPGQPNSGPYDALVLSHETLETGRLLNRHRVQQLKLPPLKLLCTRRTEVHGMSSTALRKMRNQIRKEQRVLKEL